MYIYILGKHFKSIPDTATPWTPVYSIHLSISHKVAEPTSRINGRETDSLQESKVRGGEQNNIAN